MRPYYEDDAVQIFLGDCRDILPTLKLEGAEICYTSPPYNVGLNYIGYEDNLPKNVFDQFNQEWLEALAPAMGENSRAVVWVSDKMLPRFTNPEPPWKYAQLLAWCKPNFVGGASRIGGDWNNMAEWGVVYRKGKRTPMVNGEGTTHNWFVVASPQSNFSEGR